MLELMCSIIKVSITDNNCNIIKSVMGDMLLLYKQFCQNDSSSSEKKWASKSVEYFENNVTNLVFKLFECA